MKDIDEQEGDAPFGVAMTEACDPIPGGNPLSLCKHGHDSGEPRHGEQLGEQGFGEGRCDEGVAGRAEARRQPILF